MNYLNYYENHPLKNFALNMLNICNQNQAISILKLSKQSNNRELALQTVLDSNLSIPEMMSIVQLEERILYKFNQGLKKFKNQYKDNFIKLLTIDPLLVDELSNNKIKSAQVINFKDEFLDNMSFFNLKEEYKMGNKIITPTTHLSEFFHIGHKLSICTANREHFDNCKRKTHIRFTVKENNKIRGTILINLLEHTIYGIEKNYFNYSEEFLMNFVEKLNNKRFKYLKYVYHGFKDCQKINI